MPINDRHRERRLFGAPEKVACMRQDQMPFRKTLRTRGLWNINATLKVFAAGAFLAATASPGRRRAHDRAIGTATMQRR
jgi:hypothetical protein